MSVDAGTKLGPYEILKPIGAGGMGEVYKAKDTRLDRTVAIKVLPSHLSDNIELKQRFEREARAVSSLNHPHICTLHDIGEQEGVDFLVMEYLEGETLADRLKKGALPLEQALRYAVEIADALDKAHRQGVVHRDLKPGNIMITKAGAKLLDFGLAKLRADVSAETASMLSALPTEAKPLTEKGSIIGTFQYMAPEQLEGKDADARTDIFAFGAVLYEMVTGRKPFQGKSQASLIAAILEHEPPPLGDIQPASPPALDYVIRTCLAKDPDERWQNAGDMERQIKWIAEGSPQADKPLLPGVSGRKGERLLWAAVTAFLFVASLVLAFLYYGRVPEEKKAVQFTVQPPENTSFSTQQRRADPVISPDGSRVAYIATDTNGNTHLWVRPLDSLVAQPLPGTESARTFFWSPDGRFIAFHTLSERQLKKISVAGGPPQTLCDSGTPGSRGAWNQAGTILFTPWADQPINRVSSEGGAIEPVTTLEKSRGEIRHILPQFLPDGRHFLYYARSTEPENNGMYAGSLDSSDTKRILPHDLHAVYAPPGYLLFVREQTLLAQPFDADRLQAMGDPVSIAGPVGSFGQRAAFSVSENGVLAYRPPYLRANSQLVWFDRKGGQLGTVSAPEGSQNPEISPDGTRLAVERRDPDTLARDIWLVDLFREVASRFTFHAADDSDPLWSPDGKQLAFSSDREGFPNIFLKAASGAGEIEKVGGEHTDEWQYAMSWSPDGQRILCLSQQGLRIIPLSGERRPEIFLDDFEEIEPQFSPDGKWISYISNESGRYEVYVRSFPAGGSKWQISTNGGNDARWRPDGKEIFYIAPDRKLMAVQVRTDGDALVPSTPVPLFQTRIAGVLGTGLRFNYAVSRDGEQFLIATDVGEETDAPIIVVLNWPALLDRK